jgi:hypothetical protein
MAKVAGGAGKEHGTSGAFGFRLIFVTFWSTEMPICTRCGFRNVEGTRFCGNCGAPVPGFALYFFLTIGVIGVGAAIFALIMAIFAGDDAPTYTTSVTTATPAQATPAQKKAVKPINVDLDSLWVSYHANEVYADSLYKGKRLLVKGEVQSIEKDNLDPGNTSGNDEAFVSISPVGSAFGAEAYINNDSLAQAAKLRRWNMVTLNCNGAGIGVDDIIRLDDCSILSIDPGSQTN